MPFLINIANMKTNGVTQNGNIDIGATVHNSHTANTKMIGANFALGDISLTVSNMFNAVIDPDISDQDQIANPSAPVTNQF
ncbi:MULTISPECIES: spore germination protein [Paenibacillus]|uniref:Spore germination protein GerPA/GerPF n=1 Tax=Paenibacillus naphthalenovorans TaxID=162209 RepID=A0A0U2UMH8_9BACL|nr:MULTISPECIES: spore germination protein [Paenibacillus]ALS24300.1 spore germination protein GerPA/GerPF [Paenibacillus naphthalenovorans]NTZ20400.1 spore germination protein [Paenibacillus sp. JMULE4]GCL73809.1 spore germination protein [Paenibacillus naphthalenovorans]SDI52960.1 Spore germination protein gerPA/gerPF [Paenibacillus naphthalenovorans]